MDPIHFTFVKPFRMPLKRNIDFDTSGPVTSHDPTSMLLSLSVSKLLNRETLPTFCRFHEVLSDPPKSDTHQYKKH